jgi:hypothetical protein
MEIKPCGMQRRVIWYKLSSSEERTAPASKVEYARNSVEMPSIYNTTRARSQRPS